MSSIPSAPLDQEPGSASAEQNEGASGTYTRPVQATPSGGFFRPANLNRILLVLGFIGIFDASLLSLEVAFRLNLNCGADGGCATVASDPRAYWFGMPVAFIGLAAYLAFTVLAGIRGIVGLGRTKPLVYVGYGMAGFGALTSIYFQYVALVKIGAFCPYCFGSAVNMILTVVVYALLASKLQSVTQEQPVGSGDSQWVAIGSLATIVAVVFGANVLANTKKPPSIVPSTKDLTRLLPDAKDVHSYGDSKATIKITEFADLACTHCQELTPKLDEFIDKHPGKIWTVYRHFPLMKPHPMAVTLALVSEYAAKKGKFWDYANRVFVGGVEPKSWDEVVAPAKELGFNEDDIKAEITKDGNPEMEIVKKDMDDASYFGINSTPTFFIEAKGIKIHVATASDVFDVLTASPYKEILGK